MVSVTMLLSMLVPLVLLQQIILVLAEDHRLGHVSEVEDDLM